jgi:uncharacterized protein
MAGMPKRSFVSGYVHRVVDNEIDALFPQLPALLLDGPKAIGKTATALQRAATVWRLDSAGQRAIAEADPGLVVAGDRPVLIDEWQRVPDVWDAVKRFVDESPAAGQYLLTGPAPTVGTHSGPGRIKAVRMRPLTLPERGVTEPTVSMGALLIGDAAEIAGPSSLRLTDYTDLILDSGFPGMQHLSGRALRAQLDGYIDRIVDTDLKEAGLKIRRPATVRAWLRAYAAATSTTASWEAIRNAATAGAQGTPARSTSIPYVQALTRLRILDEIDAWLPGSSHFGRLSQTSKHHLSDPALAARLLGASRGDLLAGKGGAAQVPADGTFLGALLESLAAMSVRVFAQAEDANVAHLHTRDGRHDVDLIVERDDGRVLAFEVKLSGNVNDEDVKHLLWLRDIIGDRLLNMIILTTGERAYRRPDGVAVVPLGLLGP